MDVFVVHHTYELEGVEEVKLIGVYSSEDNAKAAALRTSALPGFRDHPDEFQIDRYPLDKDHWTEGFFTWYPSDGEERP